MNLWVLMAVVVAVLYGFFVLLRFTFDMIDHRHEMLRARDAELRLEAVPPQGERDGC